ncbi:hypothetical protein GmHk_12G035420 [Glycine max]|nr:hypothetical protein GmHk_12G035420 [Glycine max]
MRQFGYVQSIPAEAIDSWVSFEEIDDNWMHYSDHLAPSGPVPEPPAAPTHTRSDVDQPRHAVEACHAITERLERLLNLRIVTTSTETHKVMEQCIRIVRGVTEYVIVYVRS